MDQSLKELRAQRASIKAHLDWLDSQIAAANNAAPQQPAGTAAQPLESEPVAALQQHTASEDEIDIEHILKSAPRSSVKRAQIGCLLFFLAATVLFLVLFFGLP